MNAESTSSKPAMSDADDDQHSLGAAAGWLDSIRAKLGLTGASTLREELEYALKEEEAATAAAFTAEEREMLLRLLRFGASRVEDIMVPRADIVAVEESDTLGNLIATFEEAGVSRVPVFNETLDDPRGMIHIKDLFRWLLADSTPGNNGKPAKKNKRDKADASAVGNEDGTTRQTRADKEKTSKARDVPNILDLERPIAVAKIRRPVLFVPPSMPATTLLIRMQSTRRHMALVVDEYGGTDGLVTIEDLVEQIVGEIEDEHDEAEEDYITDDPKLGLIAAARTPVAMLEDHLGRKLLTAEEEEEIDTLGGLVFTIIGRVPARGELVRHTSGLEFEVLDANPRLVKKLKIHLSQTPPVDEPTKKTGSPHIAAAGNRTTSD